jgi:ATP-dependent Clp protease ATP-binding subunit ClpX
VMFEIPSRQDIASVVITGDVIRGEGYPILIPQDVAALRRNKSA